MYFKLCVIKLKIYHDIRCDIIVIVVAFELLWAIGTLVIVIPTAPDLMHGGRD